MSKSKAEKPQNTKMRKALIAALEQSPYVTLEKEILNVGGLLRVKLGNANLAVAVTYHRLTYTAKCNRPSMTWSSKNASHLVRVIESDLLHR